MEERRGTGDRIQSDATSTFSTWSLPIGIGSLTTRGAGLNDLPILVKLIQEQPAHPDDFIARIHTFLDDHMVIFLLGERDRAPLEHVDLPGLTSRRRSTGHRPRSGPSAG